MAASSPPSPPRPRYKILIVDNNPVIIELLSHFFGEQGHEVRSAEDGLSALHVLDSFVPDIMFVDLIMPNISGDKLCRIVRATPALSHVYLIVLSAIVVDEEVDIKSFGANACIAKGPLARMQEHISGVLAEVEERRAAVGDRIIGIEDLTEREITKELLAAKRSFTVILENMAEGVLQLTKAREIIFVNRAAASLLATPEEKLLSTDFFAYFAGESRVRVEAIFAEWRGTPQEFGENRPIMIDGRRVTLQLLPVVEAPADETMLVILHDVTARKAGEAELARYREHLEEEVRERTQALEDSHRRLLTVLDGIDCFIYVVDLASYEVLFMNRFAQKEFGDGTGNACWIVSQNDQHGPCAGCPIVRFRAEMVETEEPVVWEMYNRKAGRWLEKHDRAIRWFDGRLVKMGLAFDVTARKQAEMLLEHSRDELEERVAERTVEIEKLYKQLLHAAKMSAVGKLAASIAHEFNNPICGIRSVLEGLGRRAGLDDENQRMVEMAVRECDRVAKLTSDLQSFNRPSSGKVSQVDVHAALDDILLLCKKEFKNRNIALHKVYAPDLPKVRAVADQIKQVFLNLLTNAREAMGEEGGTVTVTTEAWGEQIVVAFEDSGCGIDREHIEHIFEPFFSTKPEVKGTGLGLAVSYGIVQRHGGDIKVTSEPGHGTRFTVILPIEGRVV